MKFIKALFTFILILIVAFAIFALTHLKDRHPGYKLDLTVEAGDPAVLDIGFAAIPITPQITDIWIDKNKDNAYNPADGDTYQDINANGKFDPVWIAGYHKKRAAQGVHDDLWARAMVIDDGGFKLAIVALDLIGLGSDDVIDIRERIDPGADIDYCMVVSTHTHEGPDVLGLWGGGEYTSGIDADYISFIKSQTIKAVNLAAQTVRPAKIRLAQDLVNADNLVTDIRQPNVKDSGLRLLQAIDIETDKTLGVVVVWGNHPETLNRHNLQISSDFPHYLREGIEKGIFNGDKKVMEGLGGTAIFLPGAIGGLMTTSPKLAIRDLFSEKLFEEPSFEKIKVQGDRLAILCLKALKNEEAKTIEKSSIELRAKTVDLPLSNKMLTLAASIGILDKGLSGWMKVRSEICAWRLGPATFLHLPGEIYPEIVNGGVVAPEGRDFNIGPVETPALRKLMPNDFQFVIGLSNDMIGYIIPKSEWDVKPPFLYNQPNKTYGEELSLGAETAPIIYKESRKLLKEIQ